MARRGAPAVFVAHWIAGLRHAIPICAGGMRMPLPRYLAASALGSLIWTPPWVVGGYAVVWGWLEVFGRSRSAVAALVSVVCALVAAYVLVRRRRAARRPVPGNDRQGDRDGSGTPVSRP